MPRALYVDLADCSQFRQTVAARPPHVVHGAVVLLVTLLAAAVTWSSLVKANLVVRATGRVRPAEIPTRVFTSMSAELECRVVQAPFTEGDVVREGDLLIGFDTAQVDNRISKLERTIEASVEELAKLTDLEAVLDEQFTSAKEKAQAELAQAEAALVSARDRRASEIRAARARVAAAEDQLRRYRNIRDSRAAAAQEIAAVETDLHQAQEQLIQAELPVHEASVIVARRALELVDHDFAVRRAELEARKVVKQGEVDAGRSELANLNLQREESVLRSPIDGVVVAGRIRPGDVLEPGKPVLEIARRQSYQFEAIVPSQDIGNLRVGMPVEIKFDAYDYQKYGVLHGAVSYVSPDSKLPQAGDAASPVGDAAAVHNAPATFIVRVKLHAEEVGRGELRGRVKLGLGGVAEIVTGQESILAILVKRIRHAISLG